ASAAETLRADRHHHRAHPQARDGHLPDGERARARRKDRRGRARGDQEQSPCHRGLSRQGNEGRGSSRLYEVCVMAQAPMLDIKDLVGGYGSVQILNGASLKVERGAIVALLGGNGTGKSTLLKATSGLIKPWSGSI